MDDTAFVGLRHHRGKKSVVIIQGGKTAPLPFVPGMRRPSIEGWDWRSWSLGAQNLSFALLHASTGSENDAHVFEEDFTRMIVRHLRRDGWVLTKVFILAWVKAQKRLLALENLIDLGDVEEGQA